MAVDPFRLRVLKIICNALKEITPDNGYVSDLSDFVQDGGTISRVYRGRDEFGSNDPRPMVSILEHPSALDALLADDASVRIGGWKLMVQGFVQDDPENPTDPAHILAADVVKRFAKEIGRKDAPGGYPNSFGLGNEMPCIRPNGVEIGATVVRPPDGEISDVAAFYLTVTLYLAEDIQRPFD